MCADRKKIKGSLTRTYKQRKSKYPDELWDDMPLHKEPKTKRTENELEILKNYKLMMNKPKRKYKPRKSKYDADVWNSLPLHREPRGMPNNVAADRNRDETDEEICPENREELNMRVNNSESADMRLRSEGKTNRSSNHNDNSNYNVMHSVGGKLCTNEKTISNILDQNTSQKGDKSASSTNMKRNCIEDESSTKTDGVVDTLFVQVVLQTLLEEQNMASRNNMIQMLKIDKKLNSICLEEISKRCASLDCLPGMNLEKAVDEHVLLMRLYRYLSLNKMSKSQKDASGETARNIETSTAQATNSKPCDSSGSANSNTFHCYDNMNSNIQNIIQSLDANQAQTITQFQTGNLLGQSKPFLAMGINVMSAENVINTPSRLQVSTNAQSLQNEHDEKLFSFNTWEDVCRSLPLLDKSYNSSERLDLRVSHDEDLLCNHDCNEEQKGQFFESADAHDDANVNELFRLAAVISSQI